MAKQKKKAGTQQQQLSPSNYIRQKSRTLPIHECLVNADWEEHGMANLFITRKHTNGNYTVCTYLVDLKLLGVKDTIFFFNIDEEQYLELKEHYFREPTVVVNIDYVLAHNIIFAGVAFAEDFEFYPHKDFVATTQYFLEEDDDKIELEEIECGVEGKPFYVNGPYDSQTRINQILAQLERVAGPGNYDYVLNDGEYEEDELEEEDIDSEWQDDEEEEWDEAEDVTEKKD